MGEKVYMLALHDWQLDRYRQLSRDLDEYKPEGEIMCETEYLPGQEVGLMHAQHCRRCLILEAREALRLLLAEPMEFQDGSFRLI
jgi:hypothetical protein